MLNVVNHKEEVKYYDYGFGYEFSLDHSVDSIKINIELFSTDYIKVVVVLILRDVNRNVINDHPKGFGISRQYGYPFYYIQSDQLTSRSVEVPKGAHFLEIHLINWSKYPFSIKEASVENLISQDVEKIETTYEKLKFSTELGNIERVSRIKDNGICEFLFQLDPGSFYTHKMKLYSNSSHQLNERGALYLPRFYDESFSEVEHSNHKASHSDKYGDFFYLSSGFLGAKNEIEFNFPAKAKWYGFSLKDWNDNNFVVVGDDLEKQGLSKTLQIDKLRHEIGRLSIKESRDVFLIYTGTTRIGEKRRANRSMMMAEELAALGKIVIYVYMRANDKYSIIEDQIKDTFEGGQIIQIPNDLFTTFSDQVVSLGKGGGAALITVPDAGALPLFNHLNANGWRCAYEARDDWEEFYRIGFAKWYHINFERYLARKAHFTLSVSPPLLEKLVSLGADRGKSYILPNGAGEKFYNYFRNNRNKKTILAKNSKKIGYFGHLTEKWFDWSAVERLAKAYPDRDVEIIGHGTHPCLNLPNLHFLGPKNHDEILEIAESWEIGLIPFIPSRLTNAVDPIKIYEYLCLQLKVVSAYMEQIANYPNIFTYTYSNELVDAVNKAIGTEFDHPENDKFCAHIGWSERVVSLLNYFEGKD